jgi:hypothetical protein
MSRKVLLAPAEQRGIPFGELQIGDYFRFIGFGGDLMRTIHGDAVADDGGNVKIATSTEVIKVGFTLAEALPFPKERRVRAICGTRDIPYPTFGEPSFAQRLADGWRYVSWTGRQVRPGDTPFEELVAKSRESDHGEEREVDLYHEGAIFWLRESAATPVATNTAE